MTTFLEAKQKVARAVGASAITAQLNVAGVAIIDALEDLDSRHDWEWTRQTLDDITTFPGIEQYSLTPNSATDPPVKKIYTALLVGPQYHRTLYNIRQRGMDRMYGGWGGWGGAPDLYDEVRTATGLAIKLCPYPNVSGVNNLRVRVYLHIRTTYNDGETLVFPKRYEAALFALARYYFLIDRDAEDARAPTYLQKAESLINYAMVDDLHAPDEDVRLVPSDEWAGGYDYWGADFGSTTTITTGGYGNNYGLTYGG